MIKIKMKNLLTKHLKKNPNIFSFFDYDYMFRS